MQGSGLLAFGLTLLLAPFTVFVLRRLNVLDHPSARSSHVSPIPRGGGVALAVAALIAVALSENVSATPTRALAIPTALFGLLGLAEDLHGIGPRRRLFAQACIAAASLPFLLDAMRSGPLWTAVFGAGVLLWLVAFVNSFNFMDGINGIAMAQTLIAGMAFVIVGDAQGFDTLTVGGAIAVAVALGFAPLNFPRALCFLGDVGSYFVGAWLAVLVVIGLRGGIPVEAMLAPLAVYLADTASTLVRRLRLHEDVWQPHRSHVYQRLTAEGWSHQLTTAFAAAMMLLCGALGSLSLVGNLPIRIAADIGIALTLVIYVTTPRRAYLRRERELISTGRSAT